MPESNESVPRLSLCMIVKNERAHLARCLTSVRTLVDEIVIVDTGSTDGTQQIARDAGARLIEVPWENDFSRARNASLAAARGQWILVLDADEYLLEKDRTAIAELLRTHAAAIKAPSVAFNLLQKSTSDNGATGMLVSMARLFPNRPEIRYEWPIHEQVSTSILRHGIPLRETSIEIMHTGYAEPTRNREKQRRNLAILEAQAAAGKDVYPLTYFLIGGTHLDLENYDPALHAYRKCRELSSPGDELERGAQVRMVTCSVALKKHGEAIALMPPTVDASWHPELLMARGECEAALGRTDAARPWYERVFASTNRPLVPPCNVAMVKIRAALALATYWKAQAQPALAVALLRAADSLRRSGSDFSPEVLAEIYREHGVK
jgi:tetratricopeptide (TPR) repeat protein